VHRDPRCFGHDRTRWTLDLLGATCDWLADYSRSGIGRVLAELDIVLCRARDHVHSPDPEYAAKRAAIDACVALARASDGQVTTLFLDEVTLHRQPTLASAYAARGPTQPLAERSRRSDTLTRVVATLDAADGRVRMARRSHITVATLVAFYQTLVAAYPEAERLYVVQDNWPVHAHPDLLVALAPQESPFAFPRPANWPDAPSAAATRRWRTLQLPIQLVPLPTYASWLNPIEKLWRWLRQDVGHLHRWADDLPAFRAAIDAFLHRFAHGSPALLRYTGLHLPN
jgi:transposase